MSDKAKASAFIQEYATSVGGRAIGRAGGLYENSEVVFVDYLAPLDKSLSRHLPLKTVKAGKAGGPDSVAPDLLKHLPLNTQKELLFILNASWTTGWCPQAWRTATIVPFLKKDKDPQTVSSYRPIAPTSTTGNCLSDSLSIAIPGGWRRSRSSARGKPGSASADVPPTNTSDCRSSLAMTFSREIRNEPSLCTSIILRHTTLSGEPVCS